MKEELLEHLKQKSFRQGTFTLSSGKTSDFYINCKKAMDVQGLVLIGSEFARVIRKDYERLPIAGIGGLTMGADPISVATSMHLAHKDGIYIPPFFVRKEPKNHGTQEWVEGPDIKKGGWVVIVEDVITTGASAVHAINKAREHGLVPYLVLALVDRQEGGIEAIHKNWDIRIESLFTRKDFIP